MRIAAVAVFLEGCLPMKGVCLQGGGGGSVHHPLWTEFLTHACENITFPQLLLRTVKIYLSVRFLCLQNSPVQNRRCE